MPNWLKNTLLILVSCLVGLVLVEGALRAFVPLRDVGPSFTTFDPELGKRLKRSFSTTRITPEFTMRFSTNALGFRGPEVQGEVQGEIEGKTPTRPILFLGDSFTMGYGVDDGEEFPALIRQALAGRGVEVPVVNAGIGDSGNGRWLKLLRLHGHDHDPRLVVLQLMANDFGDNAREGLFALTETDELRALPLRPGRSRAVQQAIEAVPGLDHLHLIGLARQVKAAMGQRADDDPAAEAERARKAERLTYRLLEEVLSLAQDEGWPLVALSVEIADARLAEIERIFARFQVPLLTMPGKQARPELYYAVDGHWNARGHAEAAVRILDWMVLNETLWRGGDRSSERP